MKLPIILLLSLTLLACTDSMVEEFAFKQTLEYSLIDLCGKEDKACIAAVESQIDDCMEKSDWRRYMDSDEDEEELNRFTSEFYACIVDEEGNPYFVHNS
ncbi:MAG: hypothetical protein OEZ16_12815 [Chromatiales bacterium]|nr:hypothetical protein [Chromatiales bacterium]